MTRRQAVLAICIAASAAVLSVADSAGYRLNMTASMPTGLWRVTPAPPQIIRGMIVVYCLENSRTARMALERGYISAGRCPSGTEPLFKPVVAVAGDIVTITPSGISVNDSLLTSSSPLTADPAGRPLAGAFGAFQVARGEVWLLSHYTNLSFDSRYSGPVRTDNIIGVAYPVLTRQGASP
jgi:conjugative transfer signal peptidase TraF